MATYPLNFAQSGWYTAGFIAARLGRPLRTIQHWCRTGFFARRGIPVALLKSTGPQEYWLYLGRSRNDAMLKHITLDIFPSTPPISREYGEDARSQ